MKRKRKKVKQQEGGGFGNTTNNFLLSNRSKDGTVYVKNIYYFEPVMPQLLPYDQQVLMLNRIAMQRLKLPKAKYFN